MTIGQTQKLAALSFAEAASLLGKKEISSSEITETMLERISESKNNAYITVNDQAMQAASAADKRRSEGRPLSEWDGVPVALMDNFCVKDMKMTCASRMLENFIPPYDGDAAEKLEKAGTILLGKLNMDEFAAGNASDQSLFGAVKNPLDPARVAGGAAGGPAAAVAEGTAYITLGSDTGGSVRRPAAFCGIVGLKPTYGRVSRFGVAHFASSLDQVGPLGKTVEDCALALALIAGHDERDACSLPDTPSDYRAGLRGVDGLKGIRVGLPREYMGQEIHSEIREKVEQLAEKLREAGASVEECSLPHTQYALSAYYVISSGEFNSNMARYDGVKFGYRAKRYDGYEDMLCKTRAEGFGDEVKRRILFGLYTLRAGCFDDYFLKAQKVRGLIIDDFRQAFTQYDLLLTPSTPTVAWKLGTVFENPAEAYAMDFCTVAASLAGLPAISVPWGLDKDAMPIGAQLIGPALSEALLLQAAHGAQALGRLVFGLPDTQELSSGSQKGERKDV